MFRLTEKLMKSKYYLAVEAAEVLGVKKARVSQFLSEGRFHGAFKWGDMYLIPREEVDGFKRRRSGRPSKKDQGDIQG